jgi:predicted nucleic acid-binding protein
VADRWVSNASPLIVLARSGYLDLLRALPAPVLVPAAVLSELEAGDARDGAASGVRALECVAGVDDIVVPDTIASWRLDAGESQVLAHAAANSGAGVLLDDRAARRCARTLGLPVLGRGDVLGRINDSAEREFWAPEGDGNVPTREEEIAEPLEEHQPAARS